MLYKSDGDIVVNVMDAVFNCHSRAIGHTCYLVYAGAFGSASILSRSTMQKSVLK